MPYNPYTGEWSDYEDEQSAGGYGAQPQGGYNVPQPGYAPPPAPPEAPVAQFNPAEVQEAAARGASSTPAAGGSSGGKTGNPKADWMTLVRGLPPSKSSIAKVFPTFLEWYPGSSYEGADIKGPWGWFDSIKGLGSGEVGQAWQTLSSAGGGSTQGGGVGIDQSYLAPWTEVFQAPSDSGLPSYQQPSEFAYQDFQAPEDFTPPTAADVLKDPGYLWRRDQMTGGIENSAAAKGLLGSSGTLYDIGRSVGDFASQEYGQVYDRRFGEWDANWDRELQGYTTNRNNAVDMYATNYGVNKDTHNTLTQRSNDVYQRAWDLFNDRRSTFFQNQDRPLNRLLQGAEIGSSAARA